MIYVEKSGETIIPERLIEVRKTAFEHTMKQVRELQNEADSVREESSDCEIKTAMESHKKAAGAIHVLFLLDLLAPMEYAFLQARQSRIEVMLGDMLEKRTLGTANT